ncbi:hypothetical protein BJ508DRAFT_376416 [Ascobolus immersus RN42]|uniref:Uncharacterized protein n=1 Tax=Ascobolus immersus RN42 TaxID=1160509 RepID=A0A3N4IBI7_ASCIM|nr:hypothetical protein BJ508DRAFT_376416 [Ascobolus immersus RN42]
MEMEMDSTELHRECLLSPRLFVDIGNHNPVYAFANRYTVPDYSLPILTPALHDACITLQQTFNRSNRNLDAHVSLRRGEPDFARGYRDDPQILNRPRKPNYKRLVKIGFLSTHFYDDCDYSEHSKEPYNPPKLIPGKLHERIAKLEDRKRGLVLFKKRCRMQTRPLDGRSGNFRPRSSKASLRKVASNIFRRPLKVSISKPPSMPLLPKADTSQHLAEETFLPLGNDQFFRLTYETRLQPKPFFRSHPRYTGLGGSFRWTTVYLERASPEEFVHELWLWPAAYKKIPIMPYRTHHHHSACLENGFDESFRMLRKLRTPVGLLSDLLQHEYQKTVRFKEEKKRLIDRFEFICYKLLLLKVNPQKLQEVGPRFQSELEEIDDRLIELGCAPVLVRSEPDRIYMEPPEPRQMAAYIDDELVLPGGRDGYGLTKRVEKYRFKIPRGKGNVVEWPAVRDADSEDSDSWGSDSTATSESNFYQAGDCLKGKIRDGEDATEFAFRKTKELAPLYEEEILEIPISTKRKGSEDSDSTLVESSDDDSQTTQKQDDRRFLRDIMAGLKADPRVKIRFDYGGVHNLPEYTVEKSYEFADRKNPDFLQMKYYEMQWERNRARMRAERRLLPVKWAWGNGAAGQESSSQLLKIYKEHATEVTEEGLWFKPEECRPELRNINSHLRYEGLDRKEQYTKDEWNLRIKDDGRPTGEVFTVIDDKRCSVDDREGVHWVKRHGDADCSKCVSPQYPLLGPDAWTEKIYQQGMDALASIGQKYLKSVWQMPAEGAFDPSMRLGLMRPSVLAEIEARTAQLEGGQIDIRVFEEAQGTESKEDLDALRCFWSLAVEVGDKINLQRGKPFKFRFSGEDTEAKYIENTGYTETQLFTTFGFDLVTPPSIRTQHIDNHSKGDKYHYLRRAAKFSRKRKPHFDCEQSVSSNYTVTRPRIQYLGDVPSVQETKEDSSGQEHDRYSSLSPKELAEEYSFKPEVYIDFQNTTYQSFGLISLSDTGNYRFETFYVQYRRSPEKGDSYQLITNWVVAVPISNHQEVSKDERNTKVLTLTTKIDPEVYDISQIRYKTSKLQRNISSQACVSPSGQELMETKLVLPKKEKAGCRMWYSKHVDMFGETYFGQSDPERWFTGETEGEAALRDTVLEPASRCLGATFQFQSLPGQLNRVCQEMEHHDGASRSLILGKELLKPLKKVMVRRGPMVWSGNELKAGEVTEYILVPFDQSLPDSRCGKPMVAFWQQPQDVQQSVANISETSVRSIQVGMNEMKRLASLAH